MRPDPTIKPFIDMLASADVRAPLPSSIDLEIVCGALGGDGALAMLKAAAAVRRGGGRARAVSFHSIRAAAEHARRTGSRNWIDTVTGGEPGEGFIRRLEMAAAHPTMSCHFAETALDHFAAHALDVCSRLTATTTANGLLAVAFDDEAASLCAASPFLCLFVEGAHA